MRLVAIKIGVGTPSEPFNGVVRSVFASAAILSLADRLVTLAPDSAGGLPGAITIDTGQDFKFSEHLVVGASVGARGGVLRLGDSGMSIDLRGAIPWRSALHERAVDFARHGVRNAWRNVAHTAQVDGRCRGIIAIGGAPILTLCEAARRFDHARATEAMTRLVGLGAGGTPAGDDVLVGFLAGLWTTHSGRRARGNFITALAESLGKLLQRTNDVSRVYLEAAMRAEASERLSAVIDGVAAGGPSHGLAAAVAAAISVGHTSGADGVLGLILGLTTWAPTPIFRESQNLLVAMSGSVDLA